MKKIIFITALSFSILIAGCKKSDLELFPYNQVETTQAFKTEQDITFAVNGMYQGMRASGSYWGGTWTIIADVLADNLVLNQLGRQSLKTPYYEYRYTGINTYGLFTGGYTITRRANAIIENIGSFSDGAFKNNVMGEALAVRGMLYFDMSRVYSKTYLNATDADFTLPYVITASDPTIKPGNEPLKGFYDKVIADLTKAEGLINISNGVGRLNKAAVAGLLSRVYLYKGDYTNCIAAATRALGTNPTLANIATFPAIWKDATETGVLFKVKNTDLDNSNNLGVNYYQTVKDGIKSEYNVDYNFYQLFKDGDVRKSTYIQTSPYVGTNYNHIIKYAGRPGSPAGVVDANSAHCAPVAHPSPNLSPGCRSLSRREDRP